MDSKQKSYVVSKEMSKINFILYNLKGKRTYKRWENEEDRECVFKYIYEYCKENRYDIDKINEVAALLEVTPGTIESYARRYMIEYLKYTFDQYYAYRNVFTTERLRKLYKSKETKAYKTFKSLLNAKTLEEIIYIIENCEVPYNELYPRVFDYVIVHEDGNFKIEEEIKRKLKMYINYTAENRKKERQKLIEKEKEEKIIVAKNKITEYLKDNKNITVIEFCKRNNISERKFYEYLKIVQEFDPNLYDLYIQKTNLLKSQRFSKILSQLRLVITLIKNGIEEYGKNRNFDVIDYYMICNISFDSALKISKDNLAKEDYIILLKFIKQNISASKAIPSCINQIMKEKVIISCQRDNKGNIIPGTEIIFSNDEKEKLINYLKENEIPINLKTYNTIYKRYKDGFLELENNKAKKT